MSSTKQGFYSRIRLGVNAFRHVMNCWPPFLGLRIHIEHIAPDWRHLRIRMKLGLRNKNYVGTHFGGGLFTMVDPYCVIPLMNILGKGYLVWDKSARIDFIAPGRRTVYADIRFTDLQIEEIQSRTAGGDKFEPTYAIDIRDDQDQLIARVEKTVYIRRKAEKAPVSGKIDG
jgi:acyl-coenzyme A thioesterase PaaI-like protein